MSQWFKYDFVCPYCDGLFNYTITKFSVDYWKCPNCDEQMALMSVVDATIPVKDASIDRNK
jgi:ribosomal protein L37AE/L43A